MAMFDEEDRPKPKLEHRVGEPLDMLSIEEIDQRMSLLEGEIKRLADERVRKVSHRGAADAVFKS